MFSVSVEVLLRPVAGAPSKAKKKFRFYIDQPFHDVIKFIGGPRYLKLTPTDSLVNVYNFYKFTMVSTRSFKSGTQLATYRFLLFSSFTSTRRLRQLQTKRWKTFTTVSGWKENWYCTIQLQKPGVDRPEFPLDFFSQSLLFCGFMTFQCFEDAASAVKSILLSTTSPFCGIIS
jgi:hypothetical protein